MNRRLLIRWTNRARASVMAAQKEARMTPKEPKFVAEVPLVNRIKGSSGEGNIVGTAKVEQLPGGNCIVHINASGMTAEILRRGFSIGPFSVPDEVSESIKLQKELETDGVRMELES